jgi:hypothetical protein
MTVCSTASLRAVAPTLDWSPAELVTVEGVEIVQTGIEYPLASGPHTFTTEDLADAVEAQGDPAIKAPRLRLGHEGLNDPNWDGEPAVGTVANLRLDQGGHLIRGDYTGVPEWLANVLPSAYPGRSIDGELGVVTNTGHEWRLVITGLALLGVRWPGVSTLEDIRALYSKEGPEGLVVYTTEEEVLAGRAGRLAARIDVSAIEKQYYQQLDADHFWWWIRGHYQSPDELIVEDESTGDLYRVPYTVDGEKRAATFGDPVPVFEEFIDAPQDKAAKEEATASLLAAKKFTHKQVSLYATRDESRKDNEVAGEAATAPVIDPTALRALVGLGSDATDEQLNEALQAAGMIYNPTGPSNAPGAESPGTTDSGTQVAGSDIPDVTGPSGSNKNDPAVAAPTQSPVTAGVRTVDEAAYQQLVADAALGRSAYTRQQTEDRDRAVSAAIQQGRIPKSREDHWKQQWDKDPEGTRTLLTASADKGGLAPGLIPVSELGGTTPDTETSEPDDAYPAEWLPEVAARKAQQAAQAAALAAAGVLPPVHPNAHLMRRGM